ncbi:hypothetical protein HBB16_03130 [Pseudonocardia sp. MCCB 268]|nr:hypothetical protein [Pseudonocardia cytotoxica]
MLSPASSAGSPNKPALGRPPRSTPTGSARFDGNSPPRCPDRPRPAGDREPTGIATTSASSIIEPLGLQVCLVAVITVSPGTARARHRGCCSPRSPAPVFVLAPSSPGLLSSRG